MSSSSSNSKSFNNNSPALPSLTSRLSSLTSPRSVLFSNRSNRASNVPNSPGLLARTTTTLPFFRSTGAPTTPRRTQTRHSFNQLLNLNALTTVVRPAQKHVFSAPAFRLVPYAKAWHLDIVIIFTNALRFETKSLFFILYCLHERSQTLERGDIESFFEWYTPYHNFFTTVISLLHATFLPWIEHSADLPDSSSRAFFVSLGSDLSRIVRQTLLHKRHFLNKYQPPKAAEKLRAIFTSLAVRLLDYLTKLETACSPLIESHYSVAEGRKMSRSLISEMATMPNFKKNLVLLLRWLETKPETSAAWRREHLDTRSGFSYARWKRPAAQEECMAYFARKCKAIPQHDSL